MANILEDINKEEGLHACKQGAGNILGRQNNNFSVVLSQDLGPEDTLRGCVGRVGRQV